MQLTSVTFLHHLTFPWGGGSSRVSVGFTDGVTRLDAVDGVLVVTHRETRYVVAGEHWTGVAAPEDDPACKCSKCGKIFANPQGMSQHVKVCSMGMRK